MNWKQIGFRAAAVACALTPFLLLEAGLRLGDVGREATVMQPLVGFSEVHPLFDLQRPEGLYRTARSRQIMFGVQEFAAQKPADGYRVFCLGGSTVRGRPFHVETAFPQWLELELDASHGGRRHEVVNCGGLSYASYRLRLVLAEVLNYQPDLIVLAMGHNEFLEDRTYATQKARHPAWAWLEDRATRLRFVQLANHLGRSAAPGPPTTLPSEVKPRLDEESGYASYRRDKAWRADVLMHFERTLQEMVQMCRRAGVPVVLLELGSNLRDNPPFKSEHGRRLSDPEEVAWRRAFDLATDLQQADPRAALAYYQEAEVIDGQHALLLYRIARCLDRLGDYPAAKQYYLQAKEEDICPLRMLQDTAIIIRRTASEMDVPRIAVGSLIETRSAESIPGFDWYVDHVHPTIRGHQLIAAEIARVVRDSEGNASRGTLSETARRRLATQHLDGLERGYLASGRHRVQWLEDWARRERSQAEFQPHDDRAYLHRGFRRIGFGEFEAAWEDFQSALTANPRRSADLLALSRSLFQSGRGTTADRLLAHWQEASIALPDPIRLEAARFVLALDRDDLQAAASIYSQNRELFQAIPDDAWLAALPKALARGEALISATP